MTFLHEDRTLLNIILGSKILEKDLVVFAQEQGNHIAQINNLVNKLTNRLNEQLITTVSDAKLPEGEDGQVLTGQLFLEDLIDLDSFISYLHKNVTKVNKIPVISDRPTVGAATEYIQYEKYFIYKNGILHIMDYVKNFAAKSGKQLTIKTVNNLIKEINDKLHLNVGPIGQVNTSVEQSNAKNKDIAHGGPSFAIGENSIDNVNNKTESNITPDTISQTPPFGSDNLISPLDMYNFVTNMYKLLLQSSNKLPEIGGLKTQFARLSNNILVNYNNWIGFINRMPPESSASNYHDHVPYNRSKPYSAFMSMFPGGNAGSPQGHAIEAGARLMKMLETTSYALELMQRSPQLMTIFKDFVPVQLQRAKTFMNGLQSFPGH